VTVLELNLNVVRYRYTWRNP